MGAAQPSGVHLIGAGGAGMSGLGRLLLETGHDVSGSDAVDSPALRGLGERGARVWVGHDGGRLERPGRVVVSPVIPPDNAELKAARFSGAPVQTRAQALAELLEGREVVAICGSHGKTTAAAMLAFVLRRAGEDCGHYLGAVCPSLEDDSARWGSGALFVLEACEAFGALHEWRPSHLLITNIDDEHLEHYGGEDQLRGAFQALVARTPAGGQVVICRDDPGAAALEAPRPGSVLTYGLDPGADIRGSVVSIDSQAALFGVARGGEPLGEVSLPLAGLHNVRNALGAIGMALGLGVPFETVAH